jgi:hypothetical protein
MNLPILDTKIELSYRSKHLKPTSTLLQNDINNNALINAMLIRTTKNLS